MPFHLFHRCEEIPMRSTLLRFIPLFLFGIGLIPAGAAFAQEPPPPYWLGVLVEPNPDGEGTVRVLEIVPESPASKSTLRPGDVLKSANGKALGEATDLLTAIRDAGGKPIELVIVRGSEESKVSVTPEKRPEEKIAEPELAQEFLERMRDDQSVRQEFMQFMANHGEGGQVQVSNLSEELKKEFEDLQKRFRETDKYNRDFLKGVVEKYGWPGKSLVGRIAAQAAFLFAQHSDEDTAFQKLCLEKIKAMPEGEVSKQHIAMLTDRVLVHEGKKQLFGSQLTMVDGKLTPSPIEDEANVDARRKEMGMMPLADYIKRAQEGQPQPQKKS
jgi:membrane-associated protease RseP (regulator of RpoE activity)